MFIALALTLLLQIDPAATRLKVGDPAPAFALAGTHGKTVRLSEFKGSKKVVLAFFPKAFTAGCTRELSGLRDHQKMFDDASAQVLGVSMDDLDVQKKFAESLKLTFPLLSDKEGKAASAYKVKGALWAHRTTFVIDETGKITAIFEGKDAVDPAATVAACREKTVGSP